MGLEFLDVTSQVGVVPLAGGQRDAKRDGDDSEKGEPAEEAWAGGQREQQTYRITNTGTTPIDTHLLVVARGLSYDIELTNASGRTGSGDPYRRLFLPDGVLAPGASIDVTFRFRRHRQSPPPSFTLMPLSGQGNP